MINHTFTEELKSRTGWISFGNRKKPDVYVKMEVQHPEYEYAKQLCKYLVKTDGMEARLMDNLAAVKTCMEQEWHLLG